MGRRMRRYDVTASSQKSTPDYFKVRDEIFNRHLHPEAVSIDEIQDPERNDLDYKVVNGSPTVGLQRALYFYQQGVFWTHFFQNLGYQVVLSPLTSPQVALSGIEAMTAETCYPIKISHGHSKSLWPHTSYIFLPDMVNMRTVSPEERGLYCPLVESNHFMVRHALSIDEKRVLNPTIAWKNPDERILIDLYKSLRKKLKVSKSDVQQSYTIALKAQHLFEREIEETGEKLVWN